jgi:hypothetical protein
VSLWLTDNVIAPGSFGYRAFFMGELFQSLVFSRHCNVWVDSWYVRIPQTQKTGPQGAGFPFRMILP